MASTIGQAREGSCHSASENVTKLGNFNVNIKTMILRYLAIPLGIGIVVSIFSGFVRWLQLDSTRHFWIGLDGVQLPMIASLVVAIGLGTAIFSLPQFRKWILVGIAICSLVLLGCSKLIRIDGHYGNRFPKFAWRLTPTAEERSRSYLISAPSKISREHLLKKQDTFQSYDQDFVGLLGPNRDGRMGNISLSESWTQSPPKFLWRHPVGLGWAGFSVLGDAAVTLEQRDTDECVVCYHARSGEELWCHAEPARFEHEYGDGPRSTPSICGGRVVSVGATGIVTCLELATGKLHWKQCALDNPKLQNRIFGTTCSPFIFEDKVFVTAGSGTVNLSASSGQSDEDPSGSRSLDGIEKGSTLCYSLLTGDLLWRRGNEPASYASPVVRNVAGQPQLWCFNGAGLQAYDLDGNSLWLQPWVTQGDSMVNVAQPVRVEMNRGVEMQIPSIESYLVISSGYDKGTALLSLSKTGELFTPKVVWESPQLKSKISNFVTDDEHIFGFDNGILTCIDLAYGKRKWKQGRYGHGQVLLIGNKLLIQAESGEIILVAANARSHQELGRFTALEGKTWNHMALAGNRLLVRNDHEAAAIELPIE
jgi:outer membrane protein assembly factor BamB